MRRERFWTSWPTLLLLAGGAVMLLMTLFITDCAFGGHFICEVRTVSR